MTASVHSKAFNKLYPIHVDVSINLRSGYRVCDSPDYFYNTNNVLVKDMGLAVVYTIMHECQRTMRNNMLSWRGVGGEDVDASAHSTGRLDNCLGCSSFKIRENSSWLRWVWIHLS
jgi:hypothetical protein